ncbi:hypothetical protein JTE90_024395 [Oedothorax gibbosus]|uniref:DUF659 domain-containing protein n=1 Tax=Oedothorax gibbosus TaxID=931172 RepID=A0AAV6TSV7_9ARAC|nr:hypothetical protein JTE90_024395 [Oedothorax gibbosus]
MCPATGRRKMNPRRSRAAPTNRVETVERSGGEGAAVPCREERRSGERAHAASASWHARLAEATPFLLSSLKAVFLERVAALSAYAERTEAFGRRFLFSQLADGPDDGGGSTFSVGRETGRGDEGSRNWLRGEDEKTRKNHLQKGGGRTRIPKNKEKETRVVHTDLEKSATEYENTHKFSFVVVTVVADIAANMKNAIAVDLQLPYQPCVAHTLNLVVEDGCLESF